MVLIHQYIVDSIYIEFLNEQNLCQTKNILWESSRADLSLINLLIDWKCVLVVPIYASARDEY